MKHNKLLWLIAIFIVIACDGDFRPDPLDPRIPAYSEAGYRTAGAFVDGRPWKYIYTFDLFGGDDTNIWFDSRDSTLWIGIQGDLINPNGSLILTIRAKGLIEKPSEIYSLKGRKIDLVGQPCATFTFCEDGRNCGEGTGTLFIREVRKNEANGRVIVAGTFALDQSESNCSFRKVTAGRFDLLTFVGSD